jgi:biotin operon repressor
MNRPIRVRDFRNKQFFLVDDVYLNGYAKYLGVTASMVYICLCRHVDKDQIAFPSQDSIAERLGIKKRTVLEKIKILKKWGLIEVRKIRNKNGKWLNNTYALLDKSEWKMKPGVEKQHMAPGVEKLHEPGAVSQQHKDTHRSIHINKDDELLIKRITSWAYERSETPPSISRDMFENITKKAVERYGSSRIEKLYSNETNGITFLFNLKTL